MIEPIIPLSKGHLALILASGMLDGRVELESGPVVVKTISAKDEYQKSQSAEIHGGITFRAVVKGERPSLRIRVLDQSGKITEFS